MPMMDRQVRSMPMVNTGERLYRLTDLVRRQAEICKFGGDGTGVVGFSDDDGNCAEMGVPSRGWRISINGLTDSQVDRIAAVLSETGHPVRP